MTETLCEALGTWAAGFELGDAPADVHKCATRGVLDTLAVCVAGSTGRVAAIADTLARDAGGPASEGHARIIGSGGRVAARQAAFANGTSAHALDLDDTCFAGIVHGSAAILPAALAAAEARGSSGTDLLEAFIAGSEVAYALGAAAGARFYETGWWPSGLLAGIGAAAAVAKINRADPDHMARSISFAATLQNGYRAILGKDAKPLGIGRCAEIGFEAQRLAMSPATCPLAVLEEATGYFDLTIAGDAKLERARTIGTTWRLVDPGLVLKPYPLCSCAQAAAEAAFEIVNGEDLQPDDVQAVHVRVTPMIKRTLTYDRPVNETEAMFSLPYALACILRDRTLAPRHITPESCGDDQLRALASLVSYEEAADAFDIRAYPEAAEVTISVRSGETFARTCLAGKGDARNPMSEADFERKLTTCLVPSLGDRGAKNLIAMVWNMEKLNNAADLAAAAIK